MVALEKNLGNLATRVNLAELWYSLGPSPSQQQWPLGIRWWRVLAPFFRGANKNAAKKASVGPSDIWTNFPKLCIVTCATIWRKIKWLLVGGFNNMLVKFDHGTPRFGVKIPKIFELPPTRLLFQQVEPFNPKLKGHDWHDLFCFAGVL